MPLASAELYVEGGKVEPYVGEWQLLSRQTYPDAEYSWDDAQLFEAEAKTGEELTLDEVLLVEQMIRDKVFEEGGAPLESTIWSRLERLATGEARMTYKVYHAAHGSPIVWAAIVPFILANWKGILIGLGLLAATAATIAFTIKSTSIVWKAGGAVEDFVEEAPPAVIAGIGAGLLLLVALAAFGGKRKERRD